MADVHFFNTEVAARYGVNCAVILQNIYHWVEHNRANERNYHDGYFWTYNSTRAFAELFPYLTQRQIEGALKKLRDEGIIVTGNYNDNKYDRTLWYAITEKGLSILRSREMDLTEEVNRITQEVEPITNINTDDETKMINKDIKEIVDCLNNRAGTHFKASTKATKQHIAARLREGYSVEDFKAVIAKKCDEWGGTEFEKYLRPETLFGSKFEGYLNEPIKERRRRGANGVEVLDRHDDILDAIL